jgi:phage-related protein
MFQTKKALNDYYLGILYGDGYKQENYYYFSTTRKDLADMVEGKLASKDIKFNRYQRDYNVNDKENWEMLEIIEIRDKDFLNWLELKNIFSENASDRIKLNSNFVRGYTETKGTLFYYKQRNSDAWRVSFSGTENDIQYLHEYLSKEHGINCSAITQRKDREDLNIISKSYRFSIQNRKGVESFIEWIDADFDVTPSFKDKIISFQNWNTAKPFNMVKTYKNYRTATLAMAKELNVALYGKVGGGYGKVKPVYRWENEEPVETFAGWQGAYEWAVDKFNELGINPPTIAE